MPASAVRTTTVAWSEAPPPFSRSPASQAPGVAAAATSSPSESPQAEPDLLDQVIAAAISMTSGAQSPKPHPLELLRPLAQQASSNPDSLALLVHLLDRAVLRIDQLLTRQVNQILHHAHFQRLEASWRGLFYLVDQADPDALARIRVLNVSWEELAKDAEQSLDFDQSVLFHKIYEEEFGVSGGEPFGVLIGDYEIRHKMSGDHGVDDITTLTAIAQTAAAAFAPFIAGAHPSLLGLSSFSQIERQQDLEGRFALPEYIRWNAMRESEDARFVGLTAPRVLSRLPYDEDVADPNLPFAFIEDLDAPHAANYLWGNAAYAFGAVLIRAFKESGWFGDIRGARRIEKGVGAEGGGLVQGLPTHCFSTDSYGVGIKFSTDVVVTDQLERELTDQGFISLCRCKDTELSAFHGNPSIQKAREYMDATASTNARLSTMLQYMLCASRVAHFLKVMGRDWVGSLKEATELENKLSEWLSKLWLDDDNATARLKAEFPLRQAQVSVKEEAGRSGVYTCKMMLMPHSQADQLTVGINLVTRMTGPRATNVNPA